MRRQQLPAGAVGRPGQHGQPGRGPAVLACGAWLKNAACLLAGDEVRWSEVHGDLGDPRNRVALAASVEALVAQAGAAGPGGAIGAVAHDLHPDFYSTHLAREVARRLGVPAIAVQHHHAHIGALAAEHGLDEPLIGLALDGVGYGSDGGVWGGELLLVDGAHWRRLGHLRELALPGGDAAAREPWRMAAAALHALGRGGEVAARFGASAGVQAARTVQQMLARGLNCPSGSSAGRWFDAAAGALGVSVRQDAEAQAAMALEALAHDYLARHGEPAPLAGHHIASHGAPERPNPPSSPDPLNSPDDPPNVLDPLPVLETLFALADSADPLAVARGAARFHLALADALADWSEQAARAHAVRTVALGGGCFFNRLLSERLTARLERRGLRVARARTVSCGDAGLALGQAWVARQQLRAASAPAASAMSTGAGALNPLHESIPCA